MKNIVVTVIRGLTIRKGCRLEGINNIFFEGIRTDIFPLPALPIVPGIHLKVLHVSYCVHG